MKCTEAAIAPLRENGLRLTMYIDDWLLAALSPQQARAHTCVFTSHLEALCFTVNWEKSILTPTHIHRPVPGLAGV